MLYEKLAAARARLVAAGISASEAAVDVDLFARTVLGWDRARLLTSHRDAVPETLEPRFSEYLARRERREPSAYVVGVREFWGLDFKVSPAVLIPRPETERIVEEAVRMAGGLPAPRIADIGTGSGNIAVSIARELPRCRVVATDVSADALAVARENAARHGVADRVEFVETRFLDGVTGMFDLIASNPPYVKDGDSRALGAEVRHEPAVSLFGGDDGLRLMAAVFDAAEAYLRPGSHLIVEFGFGQEEPLEALVARRSGLRLERVLDDLQGIARTAVIERVA